MSKADQIEALIKAGSQIHGGLHNWLAPGTTPVDVFRELLEELEAEGWTLTRS